MVLSGETKLELADGSTLIRARAVNPLSGNCRPDEFSVLAKAARDEYRVVRIQAGAVLATMDAQKLNEPSRRAAAEYVASLHSRLEHYGRT